MERMRSGLRRRSGERRSAAPQRDVERREVRRNRAGPCGGDNRRLRLLQQPLYGLPVRLVLQFSRQLKNPSRTRGRHSYPPPPPVHLGVAVLGRPLGRISRRDRQLLVALIRSGGDGQRRIDELRRLGGGRGRRRRRGGRNGRRRSICSAGCGGGSGGEASLDGNREEERGIVGSGIEGARAVGGGGEVGWGVERGRSGGGGGGGLFIGVLVLVFLLLQIC